MSQRPLIAVSSCLLGNRVRYDGGHKHTSFICDQLAREFDLIPVCPEADAGLPVPRPPVQLVGDPDCPRALGVEDPSLDVTDILESFASKKIAELSEITGFICKARSPSCGFGTTPLYDSAGEIREIASGIFMRMLRQRYPRLPVIDEEGINNPDLRRAFLRQIMEQNPSS
jgi:uncharacterized protein YbbK (DUF523 family)